MASATAKKQEIVEDAPQLSAVPPVEFDIPQFRQMAQAALAEAGSPDPLVATDNLLATLTDDQCRIALRATLPNWIRNLAGGTSTKTRQEPAKRPMTTPERVNAWYARTLATTLLVGEQWKFLKDCTSQDLDIAAEIRFKAAAATKFEGVKLQSLATLMRDNNISTVADVAPDALKNIYGASA